MARAQSRPKQRRKPSKPHRTFPLTPHNNGQWCKKIRGKVYFFGVWADPDGALERYLRAASDLHAGHTPRLPNVALDGVTVKELCNHYLTYQLRRAEGGEIGFRWLEDCRRVLDSFARLVGRGRLASDLGPNDFMKYRQRLMQKGLTGRCGLGVHALNRAITVVRGAFNYAYEVDILDHPPRWHKVFERPSAALKRRSRKSAEQTNGKRLFSASDIQAMLKEADTPVRAMILLAINGGFGNVDCARLPIEAIRWERAVIEFDRPKTGVERMVPMWPETEVALRKVLDSRPTASDKESDKLLFLTAAGKPWVRQHVHRDSESAISKTVTTDSVGRRFDKLLHKLGMKRKGVGFYALRHTFRTWADETRDQHAIYRIMGHAMPGMSGIYLEEIGLDRLRGVVDHVRSKLFESSEDKDSAQSSDANGAT